MANKKPYLANLEPYYQAGVDPKTGLPMKFGYAGDTHILDGIRNFLQVIDQQDALNRYTWYNLPDGLTGQMIERVLYYRGQGALIFNKTEEKFYFLPYALDGTIDVYGRYTGIRVLPFNGQENEGKAHIISDKVYTPRYDIAVEMPTLEEMDDSAFLLHDYSIGISQWNQPRAQLQQPIIELMAKCFPYMNTALMNSTGITGMRCHQGEEQGVYDASHAIENSALTGQKYVPIVGSIELQELTGGTVAKSEEYLVAMQALDNFRLSGYGIDNGGLFQKKAHMLEAEQESNQGNVGLIMDDGLFQRQEFCNFVNSYTGLGMWCEVSETVVGIDKNMDGEISDEQDGQKPTDNTMGGAEDAI